jgi:hypothetical protein
VVDVGTTRRLNPGVYWVRLNQAGRTLSHRAVAIQ